LGDGPLLGVIARLSDVKGIDILIKAMPRILKKVPSANLLIAGHGPEEFKLKKLAQDLSLTGHVFFKDITDQPQELLHGFDVFIMPSLMEGLGLSVMEAQACGIPVVASRVGGLLDLIEEGRNGYLTAPNDPASLADRIIELLGNPQQAQMMARQARSNIEKHFSLPGMLKQTLEAYEQYSRR
jgi:glycosyltransferase involved in cell wall biosynthesis